MYKYLLLVIFILFSACAKKQPPAGSAPIPRRIISLAPSNTEIIIALGFAGKLAAIDRYSADVDGVPQDIPQIDFIPEAETIIGLQPDIIISTEHNAGASSGDPFSTLRNIGINIIIIPHCTGLDDIYKSITDISAALGAEGRGAEIIADMKKQIDAVQEDAKSSVKKNVYIEISPSPFVYTAGGATYFNELIEIAGGKNIFASQHGIFTPNIESLLTIDPDVIITTVDYIEDPVNEIKTRNGFSALSAVRRNAVYQINAAAAMRPSQNIVHSLREIKQIIKEADI
ncbi:MAG: ABC transporter substrate-binding protein [Spirochaetaceae bacterium]|jgi:iron complex transport system substrate-binding protein|nr:ABC transporter substrate-binding protein [Spirochaetaceae bacterium]